MTDLDRLRAAHAAVPEPDPRAVEVARARLSAHTRQPTQIRRSRRMLLVPAIAAAGLVAAVALWPETRGQTSIAPDAASAAARSCSAPGSASRCAAALGVLAGADGRALAQDEVLYRRDLSFDRIMYVQRNGRPGLRPDPQGFAIAGRRPTELWISPAGRGRIAYGDADAPVLPSPADRRNWIAAGRPDLKGLMPLPVPGGMPLDQTFSRRRANDLLLGAGELDAVLPRSGDPLRSLSVDPAALERQLLGLAWQQRTQVSGDEECARDLHDCSRTTRRNIRDLYGSNITTLLRYPLASAELRRALLTVLGRIKGARQLGMVTDPVGRQAAAIRLPARVNDGRNVVLFDLRQGRLIADGIAGGSDTLETLRFTNVYDIELATVDRIGERPNGQRERWS